MPAILPSSLDPLEAHELPDGYDPKVIRAFLDETRASEGAEISNTQKMFVHLCRVLGVDEPRYKKAQGDNPYCFEEDVKDAQANRRIDVYYRKHFVFEAKQGVNPKAQGDTIAKAAAKAKTGHSKSAKGAGVRGTAQWRDAMQAGRTQAGNYAVNVTLRGDPKPPFLIVADMGYRFWVWSSFQPEAHADYGPFEFDEAAAFAWDDLLKPEVFNLLRTIWTDPQALNEEVIGQRVTAEIADKVCALAFRLGKRAKAREVGDFLMKCIFTMFAEDVDLIPRGIFTQRLDGWIADARDGKKGTFTKGLRRLWDVMDKGGDLDSGDTLKRFNGYLFKNPEPIDLSLDELLALREAARADWRRVSPAIFGTLLERALTPEERQKLGAHYTPEAYIKRLVERTLIEPLRTEWDRVRIEMDVIRRTGAKVKADGSVTSTTKPVKDYDPAKARASALKHGHRFRRRLAAVKVLDPACGSGNFLYVAMKEMKRLEGEVERALLALRRQQDLWLDIDGESVRPVQFWGVELKPWAAKIAELVLWIGYLQWQVSARRLHRMKEPLIQELHHIENRDALISYTKREEVLDKYGEAVLRASGVTDKGAVRRMGVEERLLGVKVAPWPEADFIIGNPPFVGNKRLMDVLGSGYVKAIKSAFPAVPGTADLVMWWWWRAADLVSKGEARAFGFVTTNSITQTFNRGVVAEAIDAKGLHLRYAIADHPWYDEGAAVRIAMTVGTNEPGETRVGRVLDEQLTGAAELERVLVDERTTAAIHPDLSTGAKVTGAVPLKANQGICYQGMNLVGEGFRLTRDEVIAYGYDPADLPPVIRPYLIGRDLVQRRQERYVIDFFGLDPAEARRGYPKLWEHLVRRVKPDREKNNRPLYRDRWWLFGEVRPGMRRAIDGLGSYVGTCRIAKHRIFTMIEGRFVSDVEIVLVGTGDFLHLSVMLSRVHLAWADATKGTLEDRPRYVHTLAFLPFPFPVIKKREPRNRLRALGKSLQEHREAQLRQHPDLTLTDTYNVLAKVRAGQALSNKEKAIADAALVHTLRDLHDEIDRAVLEAYGWPLDLTDDEIVTRLVALNAQRAAEEAKGVIRWLRPDYQRAVVGGEDQAQIDTGSGKAKPTKAPRPKAADKWPAGAFERAGVVVRCLREQDEAASAETIAAMFPGAALADVVMALNNAAAAQLVSRLVTDDGDIWMAKA